jgi:hypothetical protein
MNSCGENVAIVDIATLSFPDMVKGNITGLNETLYCNTVSWTPIATQRGCQVMCAMAFDTYEGNSQR